MLRITLRLAHFVMFFSLMKRHNNRFYLSRSFYSSSATATLVLFLVCNDKNDKNSKFEFLKSFVPFVYCSIPSTMNKLKTEKYDHIKNISYSNSINDDYNNDTHDKNDDIILTEVDIKKRLGYNKNSRSSYASYPANDPCEDRIAIMNKPSYRIGKKSCSV